MTERALPAAAVSGALALLALGRLRAGFAVPFPSMQETVAGPFQGQDVGFAAAGLRAAGADAAWIQLLQYAGNNLDLEESQGRVFDKLKDLTLRVTRLDPRFKRAYVWGAGILAWFKNINRPDEALELLQEGIRYNPEDPLPRLYVAAIAFKAKGDQERMLETLERMVDDPECPSLMKALVANLYRTRGRLDDAVRIWTKVLTQGRDDAGWQRRAREEIEKIEAARRKVHR